MELFATRLKWCRERRNLTQKQIAELIGMTQSSYSKYEYNLREPKLDILSKLPKILDESTDFLLGVTDYTKNAEAIYNKFYEASAAVEIVKTDKEKELWKNRMETARELLLRLLSDIPYVKDETIKEIRDEDGWITLIQEKKDPQ